MAGTCRRTTLNGIVIILPLLLQPPNHFHWQEYGPCKPLENARALVFKLESNDDPDGGNCECESNYQIFRERGKTLRVEIPDVHAKDTLYPSSQNFALSDRSGRGLTATKEPGRKTMVKYAICFIYGKKARD